MAEVAEEDLLCICLSLKDEGLLLDADALKALQEAEATAALDVLQQLRSRLKDVKALKLDASKFVQEALDEKIGAQLLETIVQLRGKGVVLDDGALTALRSVTRSEALAALQSVLDNGATEGNLSRLVERMLTGTDVDDGEGEEGAEDLEVMGADEWAEFENVGLEELETGNKRPRETEEDQLSNKLKKFDKLVAKTVEDLEDIIENLTHRGVLLDASSLQQLRAADQELAVSVLDALSDRVETITDHSAYVKRNLAFSKEFVNPQLFKLRLGSLVKANMDKGARGKEKKRPGPKPENCQTVMCKQLSFSVTEDDLRELFSPIGAIKSVRLLMDDAGDSRGLAFIEFVDTAHAEEAVKLHDTELKGRKMVMDYAENKKGKGKNKGKEGKGKDEKGKSAGKKGKGTLQGVAFSGTAGNRGTKGVVVGGTKGKGVACGKGAKVTVNAGRKGAV